jgi:hypothetical protein
MAATYSPDRRGLSVERQRWDTHFSNANVIGDRLERPPAGVLNLTF